MCASWRSSPRTCASCCPRRSARRWPPPEPRRGRRREPLLRTLVVSDLHLGARAGHDLLRRAETREALTSALTGVERLVLLGDIVELRQGPVGEALTAAQPALRALGAALAPGARVTIVPGNHDHRLVAPWLERRCGDRAPRLGLQSAVDWDGDAPDLPLGRIADWVSPTGGTVDVAYPGCWLRDDVYATHGHYSDRHTTAPMLERLGAGAMARIAREGPAGPRSAEDYEAVLGPMYAWLDALAQTGGGGRSGVSAAAWGTLTGSDRRRGWRRRAARAAFPALVAGLNRAGLGPLSPDLSTEALRRSRLRAVGEVVLRLGVEARHVVFGHSHRAGPLPGDDAAEWRAVTGAALINTGCWLHEPTFLGPDPARSPHRPGFAVSVTDTGPPELLNLLDG